MILFGKEPLQAYSKNLEDIADFFKTTVNGEAQVKIAFNRTQDGKIERQKFHFELMGNALQWTDWQANHLFLDVQFDPFQEETWQIGSRIEAQQILWKGNFLNHFAAKTTHQADITHQNI